MWLYIGIHAAFAQVPDMHMLRCLLLLPTVGIVACRTQAAAIPPIQTFAAERGDLVVRVIDTTGVPIAAPEAVLVRNAVRFEARTDSLVWLAGSRGLSVFTAIPLGDYDLAVRRIGYERNRVAARVRREATDTVTVTLRHGAVITHVWPKPRHWWQFWR